MNRKKRLCQKRVGWTQERDCKKKKKKDFVINQD